MPAVMKKSASLLVVSVVYLLALAAAAVVFRVFPALPPFIRVALADLAATSVVFLSSVVFDNSSCYDPYWSVAPFFIAMGFVFGVNAGVLTVRAVIVILLFAWWGSRLTWNWVRRWRGMEDEDWRYADFRRSFPRAYWLVSFAAIHLFPTIIVLTACIPAMYALSSGGTVGIADAVGMMVAAAAVILETAADRQLSEYRSTAGADGILRNGIWSRLRHPNYLGEILFWWGIWILGMAAAPGRYWTAACPIAMTAMFVFVSVPMKERRMSGKAGYAEYAASVPALIPVTVGKRRNP